MRFEAATTLDQAVALLAGASGRARVLAGGTDLLVQIRSERADPDLIVDIKRISGINRIERRDREWRIGAAVTCAELGEHAEFRAEWPGVVEAAELIGSTQVQGRATIAGNLCNASPAADSVPALIAAGARAEIVGPDGKRAVAVEDVATGPGSTSLGKGELVAAILLPNRPPRSGDAYLRFTPRSEMDIAVVGAAVCIAVGDDGACTAARVALGAVAARPLLVSEAGAVLIGSRLDKATLARLAAVVSAACRPIDDKRGTIAFRTEVAGVLAVRAARIAYQRASDN